MTVTFVCSRSTAPLSLFKARERAPLFRQPASFLRPRVGHNTMHFSSILTTGALAASASAAGKNYLGFNSGATLPDNSAKFKKDFLAEFTTAQGLVGAPGKFNAVRLYTNIQAYSTSDPIQAFEAAIETNTSILLGIWTSGTTSIDNEVKALQTAVTQYGQSFVDLVIGISIGSEDLYRNSVTGVANKAGVGNQPDAIVGFISTFKKAFASTALASIPVGHVDTWDVWGNATNKPVLDAIDWIGVDEYPYYENGKGNTIGNAASLFDTAFNATLAAANGKPVWVTETGWPTTGPNWDQAVPSVDNAKKYWDNIGCRRLFNKVPTFWYNLRDSNPANTAKFAITQNLSTNPAFNLTCPYHLRHAEPHHHRQLPSSSSSSTSGSSGSGSGNGSGSGSGNGSGSGSSGSSTTSPSSSPSAKSSSAAGGSLHMIQAGYYAGLAVVGGVLALF